MCNCTWVHVSHVVRSAQTGHSLAPVTGTARPRSPDSEHDVTATPPRDTHKASATHHAHATSVIHARQPENVWQAEPSRYGSRNSTEIRCKVAQYTILFFYFLSSLYFSRFLKDIYLNFYDYNEAVML